MVYPASPLLGNTLGHQDAKRRWTADSRYSWNTELLSSVLRDGPRQGDGTAGSASANAPSMAELAAALQAAERQPQLLRHVELACVAAAELALSQVRR